MNRLTTVRIGVDFTTEQGADIKQSVRMYQWDFFEDIPEYHPMADADSLYAAFCSARKGSHWKTQVQRYRWNLSRETGKLQEELDNYQHGREGAYELSPYSKFLVNERGKTRAITALNMRDRVVKHALNDLYLIPDIRSHLIYDNGASLKGKGVTFTRGRLKTHLERFYREKGSNDGYIMTMDFSGYYDNIDHEIAKQMIRKYEPDDFARKIVAQAYDSYQVDVSYMTDEEYEQAKREKFNMVAYRKHHFEENRGEKYLYKSLSVGDQTSQITAIAFPTPIDQLVKTVCGCRYYGRYMDDLYVIVGTVKEADEIRSRIEDMARRLKLFINPRKTKITRLNRTFTFLQFKYYLADNGHVVIRINPKTVTRMRRKLKKLHRLVNTGVTRMSKVEELFRSWIGNFWKVMSATQRRNMIALYTELFGGGLDKWMKERKYT